MDAKKDNKKILFQKLGNDWYVFAEGQEGVVCTMLPKELDPRTNSFELYEILEEHLPKTEVKRPHKLKRIPEKSPA